MELNRLLMLWDQRTVLLTALLNLTKRIEVQSSQPEIVLGDLPQQRQVFVDRLKKCNRMIENAERGMGAVDRVRMEKLISGGTAPEDCTDEERRLSDYAVKCRALLDSTLASDREARRRIRNECDRAQKILRSARRKRADLPGMRNV